MYCPVLTNNVVFGLILASKPVKFPAVITSVMIPIKVVICVVTPDSGVNAEVYCVTTFDAEFNA